jgi:CheY-specific phosphatase CheX
MSDENERANLQQKIVKVINKAVKETFGSFFGIVPELKETITDQLAAPRVDISGMIAFIQQELEGTLAIRFKREALFQIIGPLYDEKLDVIDSRSVGSVGEFANIIHGVAKQELNAFGHNYQMCLPVVIVGENHAISSSFSGNKVILKYDLNGAEAFLELVFKA